MYHTRSVMLLAVCALIASVTFVSIGCENTAIPSDILDISAVNLPVYVENIAYNGNVYSFEVVNPNQEPVNVALTFDIDDCQYSVDDESFTPHPNQQDGGFALASAEQEGARKTVTITPPHIANSNKKTHYSATLFTRDTNGNTHSELTDVLFVPDLAINELPTINPPIVAPEAIFSLIVTIENTGHTEIIDPAVLSFYQSSTAQGNISPSDTLIISENVSAAGIQPHENIEHQITLTAPDHEGSWYYGACITNTFIEHDKTNNCSQKIKLDTDLSATAASAPDFSIVGVESASDMLSLTPGDTLQVDITVRNIGDAAGQGMVRFLRSQTDAITFGSVSQGVIATKFLSPEEQATYQTEITVPSVDATYYYGACLFAVSGEIDTSNNCSSDTIFITVPLPSFVVTPSITMFDDRIGAAHSLETHIQNNGNADAEGAIFQIRSSDNAAIGETDTIEYTSDLSTVHHGGGEETVVATLPETETDGTFYFGVCIRYSISAEEHVTTCSDAITVTATNPLIGRWRGNSSQGAITVTVTNTYTASSFATRFTVLFTDYEYTCDISYDFDACNDDNTNCAYTNSNCSGPSTYRNDVQGLSTYNIINNTTIRITSSQDIITTFTRQE